MYDSRVNPDAWLFRAAVRDSSVTFGVSGILRDGALVMYDRTTYSLWTQTGIAFAGPAEGMRLKRIPSERTTWGLWKERYPHTLVMKPPSRPGIKREGGGRTASPNTRRQWRR